MNPQLSLGPPQVGGEKLRGIRTQNPLETFRCGNSRRLPRCRVFLFWGFCFDTWQQLILMMVGSKFDVMKIDIYRSNEFFCIKHLYEYDVIYYIDTYPFPVSQISPTQPQGVAFCRVRWPACFSTEGWSTGGSSVLSNASEESTAGAPEFLGTQGSRRSVVATQIIVGIFFPKIGEDHGKMNPFWRAYLFKGLEATRIGHPSWESTKPKDRERHRGCWKTWWWGHIRILEVIWVMT